ncbi:MAG: hypothetical protein ACF787_01965, partial [Rhodopirellula sp. JB053]
RAKGDRSFEFLSKVHQINLIPKSLTGKYLINKTSPLKMSPMGLGGLITRAETAARGFGH